MIKMNLYEKLFKRPHVKSQFTHAFCLYAGGNPIQSGDTRESITIMNDKLLFKLLLDTSYLMEWALHTPEGIEKFQGTEFFENEIPGPIKYFDGTKENLLQLGNEMISRVFD